MNDEIEAIEREAVEGKCFSRAHVGKLAFKKIREVEEFYQRGAFSDSLVIDPLPRAITFDPTVGFSSSLPFQKQEVKIFPRVSRSIQSKDV